MVDFSNLKALDVNAETLAEFTFDQIPGKPSVWLAPATDDNRLFFGERLKLSARRAKELQEEAKKRKPKAKTEVEITPDDFDADRETDRDLLARTCIKKWGTPPRDVTGNTPEFSLENCQAFLAMLPNYMLDRLRGFASQTYNFIPRVDDNFQPITEDEKDELGN